jgi:hypothetical protein
MSANDAQVSLFNKAHASHSHRWAFASEEKPWLATVLTQPCTAPTIVDLSSRDLIHFQSKVNYDPRHGEMRVEILTRDRSART